jgi:hypothetical protein
VGIIILAVNIVIPAGFILWLWRHRGEEVLFWGLKTACLGSFVLWLFVAARWDWTGYWLRYAVLAFWLIAAIRSYRRVRRLTLRFPNARKQQIEALSYFIPTILFGYWLVAALFGRVYPNEAVSLEFPLQGGIYYVGQGGSHLQVNQHRVSKAQQYALDVTRLNALGVRAMGLEPDSNERFLIYGEPILSPCDGQVVAAHYGDPDHIQKDSTRVRLGDEVRLGQEIGLVGNSGNSTEPHLHIHTRAVDSSPSVNQGVGVPMLFEGQFLVRNSLVW